jgi:gamma-glutamyltranspeptidase/glutathione hydrolase
MKKTQGAIAAGHQKTAEAGQAIFAEGGNAFDAAVAAVLASFVTEPGLTSPAGGGFLLAQTPQNHPVLFDFFTQTPQQKRPTSEIEFYPITVNFGDTEQIFHIGMGSIAVPGNIAGLLKVHQTLGKLPLRVVAEPAIEYATQGIEVTPFQALSFRLLEPILTVHPESRQMFAPGEKLLQEGDRFHNPMLADTLTELVQEGARAFYEGEISHRLIKDSQEQGGHLTLADLLNYEVILRKPLQVQYRGYEFLTNPPPSSGGVLIAFALRLLESIDLTKIEFGSTAHYQLLVRLMHSTNAARQDRYNDKTHQANIEQEFLSLDYLQSFHSFLQPSVNKWGSTTHVSTIDIDGNAASVTTSNGEGSGYMVAGTGIMMNNMLGEADLNPTGFHQWLTNQRISSMMSPSILQKKGRMTIALGSGGSNRIRTAILQVLSNLIDFQLPLSEAVYRPRVHWEEGVLNIEPPYEPEAVHHPDLQKLTQCLLWQQQSMFFGGVHGVMGEPHNGLQGVGDPRRGGVALRELFQ